MMRRKVHTHKLMLNDKKFSGKKMGVLKINNHNQKNAISEKTYENQMNIQLFLFISN